MSSPSLPSSTSSSAVITLSVECVILAAYCVLSIFAGVLYFGRSSYKCVLLPFAKSNLMSTKQASRKLAVDVNQRWWLDVLVSFLFAAVILRTVSEVVRVADYAWSTNPSNSSNPKLGTAATIVLLVSLTSYSMVFCALIWMWLRLSLTFLEAGDRQRSCILWAVRLTTLACIVTTAVVLIGLIVVFSVNLLKTSFVTGMIVILVCILAYVSSLASLCTVVIILGVRLALLIKNTSEESQSVKLSEADRQVNKNRRIALTKISFAVGAFILALIIRTAGTALLMLANYIPIWIGSLILIALPEFVTFGALIGILWPFKVKCCVMYDESTLVKKQQRPLGASSLTVIPETTDKTQIPVVNPIPEVSITVPSCFR